MLDTKSLAEDVFTAVRQYCDVEIDRRVRSAIDLFAAGFRQPKDGTNGKDATEVDLDALALKVFSMVRVPENGKDAEQIDVEALARKVFSMVRVPQDGKDADPVDLEAIAAKAAALIPTPTNGQDAPKVDEYAMEQRILSRIELPDVVAEVAKAVEAIPKPTNGTNGTNGTSVDPEVVRAMIVNAVDERVRQIPPAVNGKDASVVEVADIAAERVLARIRVPQDGKSVELAEVIEALKPLMAGEVADWQMEFEREANRLIQREIDRFPKPANGKDGFQVDTFRATSSDGGRTIRFALVNADGREVVSELRTDMPLDRGAHVAGKAYEKADTVTYGGSAYICLKDTTDAPGGSPDWRLMVKKGRDA